MLIRASFCCRATLGAAAIKHSKRSMRSLSVLAVRVRVVFRCAGVS
jgi:hypothetical protein